MKRILFVLLMLVFVVHYSKAQSSFKNYDSLLLIAEKFLNGKFLVNANVFCEKNSNGVEKYQSSSMVDSTGGSGIMYHLVPGVTSLAIRFEITDAFDIQNIRYNIKNGIDSVRSSGQNFLNAKHVDKYHVVSIQGIECTQKSVLIELYDLTNPQLLTRIMIGTETFIPKPEIAWFAYMKDGTYKNVATEKLYSSEASRIVGFGQSPTHLMGSMIEITRPGFLFLEKSTMSGLLFNSNYELIDTVLANDSFSKKMYANGFRYKVESWPGILSNSGTYSISIRSNTAGIKNGVIKYNVRTEISKSTFKLHYTSKQILFLLMLFGLPLVIITAIIYFFFRTKNRRQKQKLQQQNEISKLKLQSIRSQLNPHFVFNALAGIQNLMNKQETEKANNYLAAFSRITRSVLDNSAKELITVDEEVKLLTDYLQMEQLRFGFQYSIEVDEEVDKHNIEIPTMLLQPFVENAVKHGVASLKENGYISVLFEKINNDLQLSITDNGKGFDTGKEYNGLGLQLSKSRIALLNTVYKTTPAHLTIESGAQGTNVIIILKNWI
jgi:anti-sigma regulatory factor (Ser/Thr protein kinase)/uncharacterized membrane-anchored protein YhcB (DUF1043 family)